MRDQFFGCFIRIYKNLKIVYSEARIPKVVKSIKPFSFICENHASRGQMLLNDRKKCLCFAIFDSIKICFWAARKYANKQLPIFLEKQHDQYLCVSF